MAKRTTPDTPSTDYEVMRPAWDKIRERLPQPVDADAEEPTRLETRVLVAEDNAAAGEEMPGRRRVRAKLKAGMELTIQPCRPFNFIHFELSKQHHTTHREFRQWKKYLYDYS